MENAVVDAAVRDGLVREAASIASGAYAKMMADESGRLGPTLMLLRACRLFDYKKVSSMSVLILSGSALLRINI